MDTEQSCVAAFASHSVADAVLAAGPPSCNCQPYNSELLRELFCYTRHHKHTVAPLT